MVIRIESHVVEDFRCFRGEQKLNFAEKDESDVNVTISDNGLGKTTLADSIQLCLTGDFSDRTPLLPHDIVDDLEFGKKATGKVSTVFSDSELDQGFRFTRRLHTAQSSQGLINYVDPLQIEEDENGEWINTGSFEAVNTVFPLLSFEFSKMDAGGSVTSYDQWVATNWSGFVEDVADAAIKQSAARNTELPEYFSGDYSLRDEMIRRINKTLPETRVFRNCKLQERDEGLVLRRKEPGMSSHLGSLAAGEKILVSYVVRIAAAEMLPATPPLIGDTIFGRVDRETRQQIFKILNNSDRQSILFLMKSEMSSLDLTPNFKLKGGEKRGNNEIVAV
jgi:predicted ATP-dependent endonuclease of OLD family